MDMTEFWNLTDAEKMRAKYAADENLQYLATADAEILKRVLFQYKVFTKKYISDLGILVQRLPLSRLREVVNQIFWEELGNGDSEKVHTVLYDNFLRDVGATNYEPLEANITLLDRVTEELKTQSVAYGIGLRGMGGECLCQVYLEAMYEHLKDNPYIVSHRPYGDFENSFRTGWEFWDIHTGEVDKQHGELIREAIGEFVNDDPTAILDLQAGYRAATRAWDSFWTNIFFVTKDYRR